MDRPGIAVGIVAILVGLAIGCLMLAFPEGINPAYPVAIAFLAPLAIVLGGLLVCAQALSHITLVATAFKAVVLCLLAIVNWAAFSTSSIQCREAISFFGAAILERYPSEAECRASLRVIIVGLDVAILVPLTVFLWRKLATRHRASTE